MAAVTGLDELVLVEPRDAGGGLATSRTLREDICAVIDGFHALIYAGRSARVADTSGWTAHAALGGSIIARGTVTDVTIDDRTETAALDVEPPERVFPTRTRVESDELGD